MLTFDKLCELEPRLRELETNAKEFGELYREQTPRCANAAWYGYQNYHGKGIKPRLLQLVGFERTPPGFVEPEELEGTPIEEGRQFRGITASELSKEDAHRDEALEAFLATLSENRQQAERFLQSSEAYDVAYDHLYELMPDCRGCGCMSPFGVEDY